MKCRSVACIWSGTPPSHRVTATAALNHPPTLYTGGSDGSIFWWNLSSFDSNTEIKPVAMLCGHAAPIADLSICYPIGNSGDEKIEDLSNGATSSRSDTYGALISSCVDGVLCIWSRGSGHCRRRRKLPPWVGSPSIICTLPMSPRYVCIGCCFVDPVHLHDHDSIDSSLDKEAQHGKPPRCTVIIVDSYSLAIVQTVFHGNLSIGPMKFMDVVLVGEDGEKHSVFMADSFGRVQLVQILKESNPDGDGASGLHKNSQLDVSLWGNGLNEGGQVMFVATHGDLIALVFKNRCIFRLLTRDATIGEISFSKNFTQSNLLGGIFLESSDSVHMQNIPEGYDNVCESFVVWNSVGSAKLYFISFINGKFNYDNLCEIPAVSYPVDMKIPVAFIQLKAYVLRIESVCFGVEEPLRWKPDVSIWSLHQRDNNQRQLSLECQMVGRSDSFVDWISHSKLLPECNNENDRMITLCGSSTASSEKECNKHSGYQIYSSVHQGQTVSSSMIISASHFVPYAVVYGFFSGEIEVLYFDVLLGPDSQGGVPRNKIDSHASRQHLRGHTGPVLCLAAHRMLSADKGWSFIHVLVSGSMDCTICIWDLDTGNLIKVMHQHVAPVCQIIFPPAWTEHPWNDCFLSVGEDSCVTLASLETLQVERMFPGHPSYPEKVVWDGRRGYIACLCRNNSATSDVVDVLYIWDVKTGARERVLRGTASHSMLDHFCKSIGANSISGSISNANTSVSSLRLPIIEDGSFSHFQKGNLDNRVISPNMTSSMTKIMQSATPQIQVKKGSFASHSLSRSVIMQTNKHPIRCTTPFPGITSLSFDLASLVCSYNDIESLTNGNDKQQDTNMKEQEASTSSPHHMANGDGPDKNEIPSDHLEDNDWMKELKECLLRFSLSFLHFWNIDNELDKLLMADIKVQRPENLIVSSGLQGDKGSLTLTFPYLSANLELWKSSSEFSAMRSLTMVSIAQCMLSLSHSTSVASSALSAFYTRYLADRIPDMKPHLLQLLVSFWQDESEHVRMAARTLFHCSASRAIPLPLCGENAEDHVNLMRSLSGIGRERDVCSKEVASANRVASDVSPEPHEISHVKVSSDDLCETKKSTQLEESEILAWLESFEVQDWISCVGGTSQDAMTSHIIVAAALAVWYPSLVKKTLAALVIQPLIKLVMAMNERYSSTAAELLAEGMESTWIACCSSEIPRLIGDIFFQIEVVSGSSAGHSPARPPLIRETLVEILLPSLAMADILGFLNVIERQIWSTASDSPVHLTALTTLIRVVRSSPRSLVQYLDKVVNFILHTMDPSNIVMRKTCLQSSMIALKEVVHVFPMVALSNSSTKLAVGDAVGEIDNASISVYDLQSVMKVKILDASAPPGLPNLLPGASEATMATVISSLSFSPDGEGLVAFSEYGLMIRWWSLGSVWWEKLSRNLVPVQCTKLIFVPPWEGFSPNSSRSSIMASILGQDRQASLQESAKGLNYTDSLKLLIHNLDLSYRLEWIGERKILLTRQGQDLGTFPL
ncbi:hypothetical protein K2173_010296 [Erythroxylum novogranatense]|uniref:Transducin/WD40 repeat-like superfamily protein n=1 Tax=Erythroxylum novogranatense TaxID=1862640 RepID=A0AAV8TDA9_9ROSI|nr:hypothetical protein K2173_010296 [Erythroxylum novogranatense]